MTSEKAFKLYMAIRLHFTTDGYDVFENGGRFSWQNTVNERRDFGLINQLIKCVDTERQLIELCVANHLYGYPQFLYEAGNAEENYKHYTKNKESLTHILDQNLSHIEMVLLQRKLSLQDYLSNQVISDLLSGRVEYESLILLDRKIPIIDNIAGFDATKYKVRMHKASKFVNKGTLGLRHISRIDSFLSNL